MKRCPSCKFIYLDTDEVCDLDGTQLVFADEIELEANTAVPPSPTLAEPLGRGKGSRTIALTGVVGLGLGVVLFLVYFTAVRRQQSVAQPVQPPVQIAHPIQPDASPIPMPSPSPSPSVEASPAATARHSPSPTPASTRASVSKSPVSTSTQAGTQTGALIRLTNGARIEADEVWRTKDGVWYRRNGMVTLLKAGQVRAIERSSRRQ
jgi:hypothetical protein